jgi:hypothetical protein
MILLEIIFAIKELRATSQNNKILKCYRFQILTEKKNQTVKKKKKKKYICLIILHWQEVPHPSTPGGDVARNSLMAKIISNSIIIILSFLLKFWIFFYFIYFEFFWNFWNFEIFGKGLGAIRAKICIMKTMTFTAFHYLNLSISCEKLDTHIN